MRWMSRDGLRATELDAFPQLWVQEESGEWYVLGSALSVPMGTVCAVVDGPFSSEDEAKNRLQEMLIQKASAEIKEKWG